MAKKLTAQESRIWEAAYAAAFVRNFEDHVTMISDGRVPRAAGKDAFDQVADHQGAERAWHIADLAVQRFREWKREERRGRGPAAKR